MQWYRLLTLAQDAPTQTDAEQAVDGTTDPAALDPGALLEDPAQLLDPDRAMRLFETYGLPAIKAIVIILVAFIIAGWVKRVTIKATEKAKVEATLGRFFGNIARWAILVVAGIAILGLFGIETTSFAAVLAALGFAIGMALSGSLGNVASGVMLLVFRPFKIGDVVSTAGVTGKVDEIGLFTTTFDTPDNRRMIVPNGAIFGSTIENVSHHDTRRADIAVGVDYGADLDRVREVLTTAALGVPGRREDLEPVVVLGDLGDSAVNWSVRVWCNTSDYWGVKEAATREVKKALDDAGIGIPFPQMDLHMIGGSSE